MAELELNPGRCQSLEAQSAEQDEALDKPQVEQELELHRAWGQRVLAEVLRVTGPVRWNPHGNIEASTAVSEIVQEAQPNGPHEQSLT
jgi:hypothetical protein